MTLDSVHFDAMVSIVGQVDRPGRQRDRHDLAERLWSEGMANPPDSIPICPIGEPTREARPVNELAMEETPFDTTVAVDAGSLNPTTFQNGLVVDVAHAATASSPSDVDLHRKRTIVASIHGPPAEVRSIPEWIEFDDGHGRAKLLAAPSIEREEETAVHSLSLEAAELAQAINHGVEAGDLLLMDGSVYPAGLLHWIDRGGTLKETLYTEEGPRGVLQDAVDLIDRCRSREIPITGVVKNWTARGIVRGLTSSPDLAVGTIPWPTDASLFQQLLSTVSDERLALRWSNWFAIEGGVGTGLGYAIEEYGLDANESGRAYDLAMMVVYDPRERLVFRIEAPQTLVEDQTIRDALTTHILAGIAREGGPPPTLRKADELARISRGERRNLKREFERAITSTEVPRYDDLRWGDGV